MRRPAVPGTYLDGSCCALLYFPITHSNRTLLPPIRPRLTMPLTPDSALELLFPEEFIPQQIKDDLPSELHVRPTISHLSAITPYLTPRCARPQIRPLASTDYERGHLAVLAVLTQTPDVGAEAWTTQFRAMRSEPGTYYIVVVVSRESDRIVGSGGVFVERKFLRGLGRVGHIEDIAVAREMQGKKLGLRIIQALTQISEDVGCYKTILNCSETNIGAPVAACAGNGSFLTDDRSFFFRVLREVRL